VGTLRPRERRLLLLGAIVAAVVIGYMYLVEPLIARHERVVTLIAAREELLGRHERLLARRERYTQERQTLSAEIAERRARLLQGDKPPLAASELQKLIKSTAQDAGVEVRSERVLPTTDRGRYTEVPVQDLKLRVVSVGAPREILATLAVAGYISAGAEGDRPTRTGPSRSPGA
jgi:Type II secretion system (T2SS), protein M subtype b